MYGHCHIGAIMCVCVISLGYLHVFVFVVVCTFQVLNNIEHVHVQIIGVSLTSDVYLLKVYRACVCVCACY